jgi:nitrite reductase/ring-hydroxylating ferredoxin subunit
MSLAALGSALTACGTGGPTGASAALTVLTGASANGAVTLAVDASSPLAATGSAALLSSPNGVFLVSRTGADTFSALSSTCTHQTCTITGFDSETYVCPCHGSRFDTSGRVLSGPANRPLRSFPTRFADGLLTITL